ncbi:hypothetical protein SLS62_003141 [Diatrype stigma]|uniref:BZIP domain-containing protein n=1 Tax=Diatrype stigma TaxID=117547 RepID=A0AAN9UWY1_9PEZI
MGSQAVDKTRNRRPRNGGSGSGSSSAGRSGSGKGEGEGDADPSSAKVRRERNRQAQHVFRIRKQAEQQEKDRHIQKLENEIEQMGCIFFSLADAITRSEHAQRDANLMQTLRNSMRRVVRMADDDAGAGAKDGTTGSDASDPSQTLGSTESCSTGVPSVVDVNTDRDNGNAPAPEGFMFEYHVEDTIAMLRSQNYISPSPSVVEPDMFAGTLSNRIIQASLRYGYTVLSTGLDKPSKDLERLFRYTLQRSTREDTLLNMQWALGPGTWFIPVLASHNFNGPVARKVIMNLSGQRYGPDAEDWVDSPEKRERLCMNAAEVERYIMSHSTGFINEDVVELVLDDDDDGNSNSPIPPRKSSKHRSDDYIDFNVFFPTEKSQTSPTVSRRSSRSSREPRTMRISQSRFVQNIALISLCTSDGPGYPTNYLKKVIASAAIKPR